jgi:hypothetical protein
MKYLTTIPTADGLNRRDALLLTVLASAVSLAGCGGGGGAGNGASGAGAVAGVSSGGTGSFSTGPISGFGSIIVGGIRFDDSKASSIVDIDDGNRDLRNQLKLGMLVRVKGTPKNGINADAETIEVRSELLGPVESIDTTNQKLKVLGQTVNVTATTFFEDGLAGLASLSLNDIVEVHGFVDPGNNAITATRIERKVLANVKAFKLQGTISAFDGIARTFKIGALVIGFATPIDLPASLVLANGLLVRLQLAVTLVTGTRKALKIRLVEAEIAERDEAEIEGTITAFTSTSKFGVNGQPVDASGAVVPPGLKLGDRVEVDGSLVKGILVARQVKLESENDTLKFELHGKVSSLNASAKTLVLRDVTVDFSTAEFRNGFPASLIVGANIDVKGTTVASPTGSIVKATRISFE